MSRIKEFEPDYVIGHNSGFNALIVCSKTGFFFSVQADHHNCEQPMAEGFIIPVALEFSIPEELCEYSSRLTNDKRMEIAIDIDKGLFQYNNHFIHGIRFDFDRVEELMEGWIPVSFSTKPYRIDDKIYKGYICSGNCD